MQTVQLVKDIVVVVVKSCLVSVRIHCFDSFVIANENWTALSLGSNMSAVVYKPTKKSERAILATE